MPIISIKTSQTSNTLPQGVLANGELAYSYSSNRLFIGQTNTATDAVSIEYIGGKLLVDKVANLELIVFGNNDLVLDRSFGNVTVTGLLNFGAGTNNSILSTKTDGVVEFINGEIGQLLQIAANGTPSFGELNGGSY